MIYTTLDSIRFHTETDEVGTDEPYVIFSAVDLRYLSMGAAIRPCPGR